MKPKICNCPRGKINRQMNNTGLYCTCKLFSRLQLTICYVLFVISVAILGSGCAGLKNKKPPVFDIEALKSAYRIKNINNNIRSFRGIGWLYISGREQQKEKYRIAFAALVPDKIRLTLMISGLPVETIIADGRKIIFVSHTGKHKIYKINDPDPSLARIISIPVKIKDIIALLSGRIPLKDFDYAYYLKKEKSRGSTLMLKRKRGGEIQKIISDPKELVRQYERFDNKKRLIYSILFDHFKSFGQFQIPQKINLMDRSGRKIDLEITGYNANIPVKDSVFTLTESG